LAEVDDHVCFSTDGAYQRTAPTTLSRPVLVPAAAQRCGGVIEIDDGTETYTNRTVRRKAEITISTLPVMVSNDDVTEALRDVIDPELGLDFVELGLIYDVEIEEEGTVRVTYTLTSPGCPIGPQVSEQIEEFVGELDGVQEVHPTMTFSPPWTPERMSEDAKFALGF
jgi:metal-sulfur cluster biosynthetic enzyme